MSNQVSMTTAGDLILVHRDIPDESEIRRRLTWLLEVEPRLKGIVVVGPGSAPDEISWRQIAKDEVRRIHDFIAQNSPAAA